MRAESDKRTVYKTDCSDSISLKKAYKEGKEILAKAGITEADLDAWYLLEFVTGITKARYYMDPDQSMDPWYLLNTYGIHLSQLLYGYQ